MGKSTLLNALVGEKMSVITSKPQTTRHRIIGILNGSDFQIVFSDTPGFIDEPAYRMHQMMNAFITTSFDDADVILFVTDPYEELDESHNLINRIGSHKSPAIVVINKKDLMTEEALNTRVAEIKNLLPERKVFAISAMKGDGVKELMDEIVHCFHPALLFIRKIN